MTTAQHVYPFGVLTLDANIAGSRSTLSARLTCADEDNLSEPIEYETTLDRDGISDLHSMFIDSPEMLRGLIFDRPDVVAAHPCIIVRFIVSLARREIDDDGKLYNIHIPGRLSFGLTLRMKDRWARIHLSQTGPVEDQYERVAPTSNGASVLSTIISAMDEGDDRVSLPTCSTSSIIEQLRELS
jgi:hypothetical protein